MGMEHLDGIISTPPWAERMEQTLARKIEAQSHVLALIVSQLEEIRCSIDSMRQQADTNTKAMDAQLQKLQDIVRQDTGGAW